MQPYTHYANTNIEKTGLCRECPLKLVKLGYAGVNIFFLFLVENINCGFSLEPPRRGSSKVYPQSMVGAKILKNIINL